MQTQNGWEQDAVPTTYNFHNLFAVRVAHRGLNGWMRNDFRMFIEDTEKVDLRVEEGPVQALDRTLAHDRTLQRDYSYDNFSFAVKTQFGRIQLAEGILRAEPDFPVSELLRWVKRVMRHHVINRGASFQYAAAVSREGVGYLFASWNHTGKTSLALSFLADGYDYMSDDWCLISESGEILGIPKPLLLYDTNFECHPSLMRAVGDRRERRKLRRQLGAAKFARSLDTARRLPRVLRRWLSDRYFVKAKVPVSRIFKDCGTTLRSPLSKVCLLVVARSGVSVTEVPPQELARRVALFGHHERTPLRMTQLAMAYAGHHDLPGALLSAETDLLTGAFGAAKCLEVTVPPASRSGAFDRIRRLLEEA